MTTTIRAHFDGKHSLVLDEPVDLPVGTPLRVHIEREQDPPAAARGTSLIGALRGQVWMSDDFDAPLDDFKEYM